ncbi:MAG: VCBS repeat-containing protein [Pirellulales bacterium]
MNTNEVARRSALVLGLLAAIASSSAAADPPRKVSFTKIHLDDKFRSEGVSVADFNKDGKPDVAAGRVWYEAPSWKMHVIEPPGKDFDPKGYSGSFCNFADDLNADGWPDQIVVDFPGTPTYWYENPQKPGAPWTRHVIAQVSNNESPTYVDVDGDGRRELVMAIAPPGRADAPGRQMAILKPAADPRAEWKATPISTKDAPGTNRYSHGLGIGDVNRDGRADVLVPQGWWEAPADRAATPWKFHDAPLGADCADMHVYDFDGDGDSDVLSSSAHQVGIWWHEQSKGDDGKPRWKTHEIARSFSQTHSMCLADINGDGLPDFVTGKRWWAHGPSGDVDPNAPAVMFWFELGREAGTAKWTPHQFDDDSGVGTQFEVVDVNGDGLLDVVTANKKGVRWFQQQK